MRFFSKALAGPQLNWSVECYGIFYGVRFFEDLLDNRPFILKTDQMNLTYLNVTLTGNHMPAKQEQEKKQGRTATLSALQLKQHLFNEVYDKIAAVHNSSVGHWGHAKCKLKPNDPQYLTG